MKADPAPIFAAAFALSEWLLGRLGDDERVLAREICRESIALLEEVALALKGRDVGARLDQADERLITLRLKLRLAAATGQLTEAQLLFALESADGIGRQLGGWLRTLGPI